MKVRQVVLLSYYLIRNKKMHNIKIDRENNIGTENSRG
jgi:hypothetical protein